MAILMIYGCGAVGMRTARLAMEAGVEAVIGGRDAVRAAAAAGSLGLGWRTSTSHADALSRLLQGVRVLVNTAGPFHRTAPALARACLRSGCHYLDVSNELTTFRDA
ncbi:saccharopine dehydrogenase NADP-binding domain-containing protein [Arthrobacter sp. CJ23]|uniref:saccharopine dehydrogenase NADP-binding domain-containing protein n=1 Tax=Arthrobacter sp. CJ23 TaxID=2972479 RepID=UPI00215BE741|nr:saccharopine dehydrogenase NADP-binding domain-containing protein [Arthrobacter sp. CJ23]UVJ40020.1 saccharopine dehydrogenase NADP-binding domain-containing protein [Arthrobacter sp. CJ23]